MSAEGFAMFDTAIGRCGIAWGPRGLLGLSLPGPSEERTRTRLRRLAGAGEDPSPPDAVRRTIDGVIALMRGEPADLTHATLDLSRIPPFDARVYEATRAVPAGETTTYGEIAAHLGDPLLARDVGQALARNPFAIVVPCHRVLAAGGATGGFTAPGGTATKTRMLDIERARTRPDPLLFDPR